MTTATETTVTTQVFTMFIKSTPQAIWDAITEPEWNASLRLPRPQRVRAPARRDLPRAGAEMMVDSGLPTRSSRRRGARGRSAAPAGADLAVDFVAELRAEPSTG